ncbi:MAG: hypothetical protein ACK5H1_09430 [Tenacibaculum sp.]
MIKFLVFVIMLFSFDSFVAVIVIRQVLLAFFLLSVLVCGSAQISKYSLFALPKAGKSEIDNVSSPNKGSLVYNTDDNQIYMHNGADWQPVHKENAAVVYGNIKYSVQSLDHLGWYILDGREISSLPNKAQQRAEALGFTTKLPDAKNRVLKHLNTSQNIGDIGGKATTTLTQNNLPNVNFAGSTDTSGDHNHTIPGSQDKVSLAYGDNTIGFYVHANRTTPTSDSGAHKHSISLNSGGKNQPFDMSPPYLAVNTFIYLGL